ncbi:amidohydrolase family protein [Paenibacillus doosanensis]|uniref:Amidohydrolase n=2 Tax=Paenibacillus konkukensis TaxID=2020716 RepID=A0ABY4RVW4_9BACL|nr:amidohydrolase family protein [Paenibacillus doosanensis]MCS7464227.1 amidohydrolase family protein [Paenibacillus doosanensis]UQZ85582.1 Amidohydrolase [Paenibacillus konkukensis]
MIIDVHSHPIFYKDICGDKETLNFRKEQFGIFKQSPYPLESALIEMGYMDVAKTVLLPEDITTLHGGCIITNEEIKSIVDLAPDRFIGFASVDPHRPDAVEVLEHAFTSLGLKGLKLHPSKQQFYPYEEMLKPIYEICLKYDKPVMFHAGMSWQPDAPAKYSHPLHFEEVAIAYPKLRMCLAHFGWPWIHETVMLLLKYPNIYTDTSLLHMDNAKDFYEQVFTRNMGPLWIERNLADKVMFGTNAPRFRAKRLLPALKGLHFRDKTLQKILGLNALKFIGLER